MVYTKEEKKEYNKKYYEVNKLKNKCEHGKQKSRCKECGGREICEHERIKTKCVPCKGGSICEHNKQKTHCIECQGSSICEHSRVKGRCKECQGTGICEHNKRKYECIECGGTSICIHNKLKSRCKDCGGNEICIHNRQKYNCKDCRGSGICEHNKQKSFCKDCKGSSICEHNKLKRRCKECKGSSICEHNRRKDKCKECLSPEEYFAVTQRNSLNRVLKCSSNIKKTQRSIEYLGCTAEYFLEFLKNKMTDGMNFNNIHLDHIKPVSRFNLDNPDEFSSCVHYTNFQPLLAADNMIKSNKWSDEDEIFWNENIKGKEYNKIYIPV